MNYKLLNFKLIFFLIIFLGIFGVAKGSWAAMINAGSCSQSDVQNAIDSAQNGDVVLVPNGTCQWGNTVTINGKYITLQGNGADNTIIQNSQKAYYSAVFQIFNNPFGVVRVTGFTFDGYPSGGSANDSIQIQTQGIFSNKKIRLDHLKFVNGYTTAGGSQITSAIYARTYTLIDHCIFIDGGHADIAFFGPSDSWKTDSTVGSDNNSFVEDCTFQVTLNAALMNGQVCEMYDDAQVVVRHSTIIDTKIGNHGPGSSAVGVRSMEIYNNNFQCINCGPGGPVNIDSFLYLSGASGVVYNNTFSTIPYAVNTVKMEYVHATLPTCVCSYPGWHQLGRGKEDAANFNGILDPLYFWNNGSNITFSLFDYSAGGCDATCGHANTSSDFIINGRDYYKNTAKPGYTPYTYPHPLQNASGGSDTTPPAAPQGLSVQ